MPRFRGRCGDNLVVAAVVQTVIGELEPAVGILASAILHQPTGLGSVLPPGAGALSMAGTAAILMHDRHLSHAR